MRTIEQLPQLPARTKRPWQHYLIDGLLGAAGSLAVTGIIYGYHLYPTIPNISIVYLLVILALASTRGRFAAVVAFLSFDFFLIPPFSTFVISRWEEWIALFVFLATALITSQLAATTRQSVEQARRREREARILYEAGRVITSTDNLDEQLDSIALALVRIFSSWVVLECALLVPDEDGTLSIQADAPIRIERFTLSHEEVVAAREVMAQGNMREVSQAPAASTSPGQHLILRLIPLKTGTQVLGVLCLRIEQGVSWFVSSQSMQQEEQGLPDDQSAIFFWTFLNEAVMVIERARLRAQGRAHNE